MKTIIAQFIQSAAGAAGWVLHAQRGQDGGHGAQVGLSSGLGLEHHGGLLLQVVGLGTDLSLGLQALNQAGLLPAHLGGLVETGGGLVQHECFTIQGL